MIDFSDRVIGFGVGHSVYDGELFERVQRVLAPCTNVILLLPSPSIDESAEILKKRYIEQKPDKETSSEELELMDYFLRHPSNQRLAKRIVYTKAKSPEQTCDEIIQLLS